MARMPTFCNPKPTADQMQQLVRQHFLPSASAQKDRGPDQRGFIIGSVRL